MRLYHWTSFCRSESFSPFKGMWLQNPCVLLSSKTNCIMPLIFVSDVSKQEGSKIFLQHSWQLSFHLILPLSSLTRQTPWLAVNIQGYLSSCSTYSFTESEGVSKLTNLAFCMGAWIMTIPNVDITIWLHLRIESFNPLKRTLITLLFFVLIPSEIVFIILSAISSCF